MKQESKKEQSPPWEKKCMFLFKNLNYVIYIYRRIIYKDIYQIL